MQFQVQIFTMKQTFLKGHSDVPLTPRAFVFPVLMVLESPRRVAWCHTSPQRLQAVSFPQVSFQFRKIECGWLQGLSIVSQMARHQAKGWEHLLLMPLLVLMVTKKVQSLVFHAVRLMCPAALCPLTSLLLLALFSRLDRE